MIRRTSYIVIVALVMLAALTLGLRFALSQVEHYEDEIVAQLSRAIGAEVRIGEMRAVLVGVEPVVELLQVRVAPSDSVGESLRVGRMRIGFDLFASLLDRWPRISELFVFDTDFTVVTDAQGNTRVPVLALLFAGSGFSAQSGAAVPEIELYLKQVNIHWRDQRSGDDYEFNNASIALESVDEHLRFAAKMSLPPALGRLLHIAADLERADGGNAQWRGRTYVHLGNVQLAPWVRLAGGPRLVAGVLNTELWGNWQDGGLRDLHGAFDCRSCVISEDVSVSAQTRLSWETQAQGWRLGLLDLGWADQGLTSGLSVRHGDIAVAYQRDRSRVVLRVPELDQVLLHAAARMFEPGIEVRSGHGAVRLSADLSHPDLRLPPFPQRRQEDVVDWRQRIGETLQFVAGYAAEYTRYLANPAAADTVHSEIELRELAVALPAEFGRTVELDELAAAVRYLGPGPSQPATVYADALSLRLGDARISGAGVWAGLETPVVDGALTVAGLPLTKVKQWLPQDGLKPRLKGWLEQAFGAGVLKSAKLELSGDMSRFPFKAGGGRFHLEGEVADAVVNYRTRRQPLRDVVARFVFDNQGMAVEASKLRYYDLDSRFARVVIADLTQPVVEVDAVADGPFASVLAYLEDAQLVDPDSLVIRSLEAGGDSRLSVSVQAPLSRNIKQPVRVNGQLDFDNTSLRVVPLDLEFTEIDGVLDFDRDGGRAESLTARLNGTSVVAHAEPAGTGEPSATTLTIHADLPLSQLADLSQTPLGKRVNGSSPWRAELFIPGLRAGADYEFKVALFSSLVGTEIDLPVPFYKAAAEQRGVSAHLTLGKHSQYKLVYGGDVEAMLRVGVRGGTAASGYLHFGRASQPAYQPGAFRIGGEIGRSVEIDEWLELLADTSGAKTYLNDVEVSFAELTKGGEVLGGAEIQVRPRNDGRELRIDGGWAKGWALIPSSDKEVFVKMEHLALPARSSTPAALDPATLPPLEMEIARFKRGDLYVSDLLLVTRPIDGGMNIGTFSFEAGEVIVTLSGTWLLDGRRHHSRFKLDVHGRNYGRMLRQLGVSESLKDGAGSLVGRIEWHDQATSFALEKIEGSVKLNLKDGVIEQAEPGLGRLLGLFSVGHIVKRLSLDFRDVIEKGMAFDTMDGTLNFSDRVMTMEDFVITGPALAMEISGENRIAEKRYDQQIAVVPNLSSGLPIAGALLGGPLAAAAVYLVDKMTKWGEKVDQVVTLHYHLHGSWDKPQIDFKGVPEVRKGSGKLRKFFDKVLPNRSGGKKTGSDSSR